MGDLVNYGSPGYNFTREQGELGINRALAQQGRYGSGAALKSIASFNTGLAAQHADQAFNNYQNDLTSRYNRLAGVAGTGQQAVMTMGQLGNQGAENIASSANIIGQNQIGAGNAQAAGKIGQANAYNNLLSSFGSMAMGGSGGTGVNYGLGGQTF